jgi:NAD(P)-dependent dehydrogenase (short-subunit alcohol dehydrogenase family)
MRRYTTQASIPGIEYTDNPPICVIIIGMEIKGKVALITGGAHRVGKLLTLSLAGAGANVVVNYHASGLQAEETVHEAQAMGVQAMAVQGDIADYAQVQEMAAQVRASFDRVDILVNSASHWEKSPFPSEDTGPWERVTRVIIDGAYYVTNMFAPMMLTQGAGVIINLVDLSAWEAWPDFTAHVVGKSALLAMTRQFALELAPTVRVNAVAPGPVLPRVEYGQATIARIGARTLLNRWGAAQDVAHAVKFLIEADYITGEVIFVDGGDRYGCRKRIGG